MFGRLSRTTGDGDRGPRTIFSGKGNNEFLNNGVSTRKYTWLSFLPVSLLFQFRSISNVYFLLVASVMLIPGVAPVSPYSAIIPLCFVLFVSEVREFVEEYQKYRRDVETNATSVKRLVFRVAASDSGKDNSASSSASSVSSSSNTNSNLEQEFTKATWESLLPGDMVLLFDRDKIPADIIVAYTPCNSFSYVETSNLDGETNLKTRAAPSCFDHLVTVQNDEVDDIGGDSGQADHILGIPLRKEREPDDYDFRKLRNHKIVFEAPNPDMYRFKGSMDDNHSLSINNVMLRGCSMRNTPWAIGIVVYAGHESKAMLNTSSHGVVPSKKTQVEGRMNVMVLTVFICQMALVAGATIGYSKESESIVTSTWYLSGLSEVSWSVAFLTFFILLSTIIPVSLWVSLEVLKFFQALVIQGDNAMKDSDRSLACVAHSKNMHEELGQVTHVFTDKTGTLTCNRMEFKGCAIGGKLFVVEPGKSEGAPRSVGGSDGFRQRKRRNLGFSGAIPIGDDLLDLISSSMNKDVDSVESEFFKCIALCHSCERVAKHDHHLKEDLSTTKAGSKKRTSILGWLSPKRVFSPKHSNRRHSHAGSKQGGGSVAGTASAVINTGVSRVYIPHEEVRPTEGDDRMSEEEPEETVNIPDFIDKKLARYIYQSTSPDEAALVSSAADIGYFFHKRLQSSAVQLDIHGKVFLYEILHQVAFTSDRRMMTVVVRRKDREGTVVVYSKGADSSILPKLDRGDGSVPSHTSVLGHTRWAVDFFAEKGLRTLCLGKREMSFEEWTNRFGARISKASANLDTRDTEIAKIDTELECCMQLLGCTAVEDKLQEGVHETISAMRNAGITLCMITGDKRETAVNIARSCKLVNSENNVYTMSTQDNMYGGGNFIHLFSLAQLVGDGRADPLWGMTTEGRDAKTVPSKGKKKKSSGGDAKNILPKEEQPGAGISVLPIDRLVGGGGMGSDLNGGVMEVSLSPLASHVNRGLDQSTLHLPMERSFQENIASTLIQQPSAPPTGSPSAVMSSNNLSIGSPKFCIVLDGAALSILLANPNQTKKLLSVMAHPQCEAAVFCRVNPKQKGLIVKSCRNSLKTGPCCVLAIGDGANDISMIKEAHVGIGIFGEEGWQAAGSADYAITKFKDLYRLLFLHGRWNYMRITFFICFFMYKNFAFTFLQFWIATLSQWSGVTTIDSICLLTFNSVFMVAPMFMAGLFDKDIHPDLDKPTSNQNMAQHFTDKQWFGKIIPELYKPGQRNEMFKAKVVVVWLILGTIHSVIVFFGVYGPWGLMRNRAIEPSGRNASFTMEQQALYTTILMMLVTVHATLINEWNKMYLVCVVFLHITLYILFTVVYDSLYLQQYAYIMGATFTNGNFWFVFFAAISVCVLPLIIAKFILHAIKPSMATNLCKLKSTPVKSISEHQFP